MRIQQLPQPIVVRLLEQDEECQALEAAAKQAEKALAENRDIINGRLTKPLAEHKAAQAAFPAIHQAAIAARQRAVAEATVLANVKRWLDGLESNSRVECVFPDLSGWTLASVRSRLT